MSLSEPILGLLPASESEVLEAYPRVSPDFIRGRLRRLRTLGVVTVRRGKFIEAERPGDEEPVQKVRRGNPNPKPRTKTRTCEICGTTYAGIRKHFGTNAKHCRSCRGRARSFGQTKERTCPSCGVTYHGVVDNFKRAGRVRSTCNSCGEREVRERIAMRRAKT